MKRTFFAIKIKLTDKILSTYSYFKNSFLHEKIKWVDPNQFHITLFFLGATQQEQIPSIIHEMKKAVSEIPNFHLVLKGCGVFPSQAHPSVLWLGVERNPVLENLKLVIDNTLILAGFEPERRPFSPHLTIGRIKEVRNNKLLKETLGKFNDEIIEISQITGLVFYESRLTPSGPEYFILNEFPFR